MHAQHNTDANAISAANMSAIAARAAAQDNWEAELDAMGTEASVGDYQAHLDKAPDQSAESTIFLKGFVAAKSQPF